MGGGNDDWGEDIALDSTGNLIITGFTGSSSGIATSGTYQTSLAGSGSSGYSDAFIVKFTNAGALLWGTYYGGVLNEEGTRICISGSTIIIGGYTNSTSGIATSGAYQTSYGGGYDAFIAKFSYAGAMQWASYFGGANFDACWGICADRSGNIFATGYSQSTSGIATTGVYQTALAGTQDGYLCKFTSTGSMAWSTYFGGNGSDGGDAIVMDTLGHIFLGGYSTSTSGIATSGAYQTTFNGVYDGLVIAFTSGGGLPVQLVNFEAKPIGNWQQAICKVLCTWQTASELNNDYFEIERSTVGSPQTTDWKAIGKVKGNGTTNSVHSYQFTDNVMLSGVEASNIYYRLKQVDFDGKSSLSEVRVVNFNQSKNTEWNIYPNPATNELHIETSSSEKLTAQVFDITGKKVIENILFTNTTTINTSSLVEGMYFLRITNADGAVIKVQKVGMVR